MTMHRRGFFGAVTAALSSFHLKATFAGEPAAADGKILTQPEIVNPASWALVKTVIDLTTCKAMVVQDGWSSPVMCFESPVIALPGDKLEGIARITRGSYVTELRVPMTIISATINGSGISRYEAVCGSTWNSSSIYIAHSITPEH